MKKKDLNFWELLESLSEGKEEEVKQQEVIPLKKKRKKKKPPLTGKYFRFPKEYADLLDSLSERMNLNQTQIVLKALKTQARAQARKEKAQMNKSKK